MPLPGMVAEAVAVFWAGLASVPLSAERTVPRGSHSHDRGHLLHASPDSSCWLTISCGSFCSQSPASFSA